MRKILPVLLFLFMLSPVAHSAPGAVRCGKLLDVRSGQMLSDQLVVFDASGTITSVSSSSSTKLPNGVTAIDLSNATFSVGWSMCTRISRAILPAMATRGWAFPFRAKLSPA
jgi:hypothetical protein